MEHRDIMHSNVRYMNSREARAMGADAMSDRRRIAAMQGPFTTNQMAGLNCIKENHILLKRELCPHCLNWKTGYGCTCSICNDAYIKKAGEIAGESFNQIVQEAVRDTSEICVHENKNDNEEGWTCRDCGFNHNRAYLKMSQEIDDELANAVRIKSYKPPDGVRVRESIRNYLNKLLERFSRGT